jgi:hypothetical protein
MFTFFLFTQLVHSTVQAFSSGLRSLIVTERLNVHYFIDNPVTAPYFESDESSSHPYPSFYDDDDDDDHHHHHHPMCA